jgi:hypothetical protein
VKNILENRKDEIVANVGEDGLKKLQKVKLLKLMELEIQQLLEYWSLSQILKIINSELELKISKTVFYDFCAKKMKKDEKLKVEKNQKTDKGLTQKRDIKKESILDEDELNAIAMFGSSSKNQVKD